MLLSDLETNYFQSKNCEIIHHGYCSAATFYLLILNIITNSKTIKIKTKPAQLFLLYQNRSEELWLMLSLHSGKYNQVKHRSNLDALEPLDTLVLFVVHLACNPELTWLHINQKWNETVTITQKELTLNNKIDLKMCACTQTYIKKTCLNAMSCLKFSFQK